MEQKIDNKMLQHYRISDYYKKRKFLSGKNGFFSLKVTFTLNKTLNRKHSDPTWCELW